MDSRANPHIGRRRRPPCHGIRRRPRPNLGAIVKAGQFLSTSNHGRKTGLPRRYLATRKRASLRKVLDVPILHEAQFKRTGNDAPGRAGSELALWTRDTRGWDSLKQENSKSPVCTTLACNRPNGHAGQSHLRLNKSEKLEEFGIESVPPLFFFCYLIMLIKSPTPKQEKTSEPFSEAVAC